MNALTSSLRNDSFAAHFDAPLPRDLRNQAGEMSWTTFNQRFSSTNGPIRLGSWDSRIARGGRTTYDATFGIGNSIHSATATTYGPIDALTSMLYNAGFHIEIISFHQQNLLDGSHTATFILGEFDGRQEWSMAIDHSGTESSIRSIIGAANILHS